MKFLFVALLSAFANTKLVDETTIEKMNSSSFGKNILQTIALELKSKDSSDDLIQLLRDQEDKLQNEQSEADDRILAIQNKCVVDLQRLVDQIEAAKKRIKEIKAELKVKVPLRDQKIEEREDLRNTRDLLVEKIAELDANKKVKVEEYKKEQKEHDHAASIFQSAKAAIEDSVKASFVQKSLKTTGVFAQISNDLNAARRNHFTRKSWNSVMKVLAQLTGPGVQADQQGVNRILEILEHILETIAQSREFERRDFEIWIQEYKKTRNALQKRLDQVNANIEQLTIEIDTLTKRINLLREEQVTQEQRVKDKTEEHNELETYCDDEAQAYSERRQAYSDQIEVVSDAIALLTSQIRTLKKFVSEKLSL